MATALIDQWIAANGPLPKLTFGDGADAAANAQAETAQAFRYRVAMATASAAVAISSEASTATDHPNRAALAKAVLQNPQAYLVAFAQALASQGVDETSNDAAINSAVSSVWDALAG